MNRLVSPWSKKLRASLVAAIFASIVAGTALISGTGRHEAEAQPIEINCGDYRFCIAKETIPRGSLTEFAFIIEMETYEQGAQVGGQYIDGPETIFLSDGESAGIEFRGEVRIREILPPGWELVDVRCNGTPDYIVERIPGGIEVYYGIGGPQSFLDCVWINREIPRSLNLGGLFSGQPTPLPTAPAPAAVAPAATAPVISPPRTGDAGLK